MDLKNIYSDIIEQLDKIKAALSISQDSIKKQAEDSLKVKQDDNRDNSNRDNN